MSKNKGDLFNVDNVEEVKKLVTDIYNILHKGHTSMSQFMDDNERMVQMYKELQKISEQMFKQDESAIHTRSRKFQNEIDNIYKESQLIEERIKQEATLREEIEKRIAAEKQEQKFQRDLNQAGKEAYEAISRTYTKRTQAAKEEYKNLNFFQKLKYKDEDEYVTKRINVDADGIKVTREGVTKYILNEIEKQSEERGTPLTTSEIRELVDKILGDDSSFGNAVSNFSLSSSLLQVGADTLKSAANVIISTLSSGFQSQVDTYENTFQNISVRTGLTTDEYLEQQKLVNNQLDALDLYNNIATSDVQEMWNSLAEAGMSSEDMFANAIENVITETIVPYLDTTTTSFNLLNNRLDGNFVKQIRGINVATQDLVESSYMNETVLNSMIDALSPMSDWAIQQLASSSTELAALADILVDQYGFTEDQAMSYITQLYKQQQYGNQILSSGTVAEKLAYINQINSGTNIYTDMFEAVLNNIETSADLSSMLSGYDDTMSGLLTSIVADALGLDFESANAAIKAGEVDIDYIKTKIGNGEIDLDAYAEAALESLSEDENQTETQLGTITLENFMNELAATYESLGLVGSVLKTAISGVGTVITTYLGLKFINLLAAGKIGTWLSGMVTSGKTVVSTLGTAATGTIAGTLATGVVLAAATVAGIGAAVNNAVSNQIEEQTEAKLAEFEGTELEGNTTAALLSGIGDEESNLWSEDTTVLGSVGNFFKTIGGNLAQFTNNISTWWGTEEEKNTKRLNNLQIVLDQNSYDEATKTEYVLAWALLADSVDQLEAMGMSRDELKQWVESDEGPSVINAIQKIGKSPLWNYQPHDSDGNKVETLNQQYLNETLYTWSYHRQGIDEVPYDDYPAILHEGEAVLTASTANELRNLTDTYRETVTQSYDLEAIIQDQTSALISKMDEIISAMSTNTVSGSTGTNTASSKLFYAMKTLTSTKLF